MSLFSTRLKKLRVDNGFSRKEVADYLGIHETTYGKYELGHREPNFETLSKLANLFDITTDYLLIENTPYTSNDLYVLFGMLVKQKRKQNNESIDDLANFLNVTPIQITEWENASQKIDYSNYTKILKKYNISTRQPYYYINKKLGNTFALKRKELNYSLEAIAKHFGYSCRDIEQLEQGDYILIENTCKTLCLWYKLKLPNKIQFPNFPSRFFDSSEKNNTSPELTTEEALLIAIKKMLGREPTEEELKKFLDMTKVFFDVKE